MTLPDAIKLARQHSGGRQVADADACGEMGNACYAQGQFDQAIVMYRAALALSPAQAAAHWNLGLTLLLKGDFSAGWPEYEWRTRVAGLGIERLICKQPQWDARPLEGRRILLYAEQGLGDTIQFARYVPLVARAGGKIILGCQPTLAPLLSGMDGVEICVPQPGPAPADFDVHCSLPSLPGMLRTTLASIPASVPYLFADATRVGYWRGRLGDRAGLNVGLVWAGRPSHQNDRNRSLPLSALAPLGDIPGINFISLQKGEAARQVAAGPLALTDYTSELSDFAETAALVANLDLVISADTSVAHLAGAMGKRVWVLLPWAPDWRWLLERGDSPWYPGMRLFRQDRAGDWSRPIARVAGALGEL